MSTITHHAIGRAHATTERKPWPCRLTPADDRETSRETFPPAVAVEYGTAGRHRKAVQPTRLQAKAAQVRTYLTSWWADLTGEARDYFATVQAPVMETPEPAPARPFVMPVLIDTGARRRLRVGLKIIAPEVVELLCGTSR
jgi:hypothetical protein